jgi:hypothetical protein
MQQFLHTIYVPVIWIIFQIKHFFVQTNWRRGYLALVPNLQHKVIKTQREKQGIEKYFYIAIKMATSLYSPLVPLFSVEGRDSLDI